MAEKIKLKWHAPSKSWRKYRNKKTYHFKHPNTKAGQRAAWAEWQEKLSELEGKERSQKPNFKDYEFQIRTWEGIAEWSRRHHHDQEAKEALECVAMVKQWFDEEDNPPRIPDDARPIKSADDLVSAVWADRIHHLDKKPSDTLTYSDAKDQFLDGKKAQAKAGTISAGRVNNIILSLRRFGEFFWETRPLEEITEATVEQYYIHLLNDAKPSSKKLFDDFRQFVKWTCSTRLLDILPRNLDMKRAFTVRKGTTKVKQTFDVEEFKELTAKCSDQMKCWLLLGLNCGYTQIDIGELKPSEVDWKNGRIIRQRSKERDEDNGHIPTIDYKLWDETFRLIKKLGNRHGDYVFLSERGTPVTFDVAHENGTRKRKDNIGLAYRRLKNKPDKGFKTLRKTGNSKLKGNRKFAVLRTHFLGHSLKSIVERHYDVNDPEFQNWFDDAVNWLGKEFGFSTKRK